jgi:hypothetical protein
MIYNIYPKKDSTIYERYDTINTGIDSIIELYKILVVTGSVYKTFNSRILMQFDYSDLNDLVAAGFNTSSTDSKTDKYILKLYSSNQKQLPTTYTLEVNAISGSWEMGVGKYDYNPRVTEGVSWTYRDGVVPNTDWAINSFAAGSTGSYSLQPGGCNWYTGSNLIVTRSIGYNEATDIDLNISNIVYAHLTGSVTNHGILIRRTTEDELSTGDSAQIQFFSLDTNTIYLPHIRVNWDDSTFNTGSLTALSGDEDTVVYFKNLNREYSVNDRVKLRILGRPKYPAKTFATSSAYSSANFLPASSSYSIEDLHTKEIVIPHDYTYTRISCDPTSSFFNFWMNGLQPERWYKFTLRSRYNSGNVKIYDSEYIFKVNRVV